MKLTRRRFLKSMGLGATALAFPNLILSCSRIKKQPNILFIMSDDHAKEALSCYSRKLINTPNIDRIAKEGIRFENSFVTNSICAPSRAVILTGKYSHKNGLRDNLDEFDGSQTTFPKLLQKAGYQTAIVGKWHLKTTPTGFDEWKVLIDGGEYYNPLLIENGEEKNYTGYITDIITDKAIDFMEQLDQDKPFCLLVHHKAPHRNWMPDAKHLEAFNDRDLPLPETFYDDYEGRIAAKEADMRIADMFLSFDLKLKEGSYEKETGTGGNAQFAKMAPKYWKETYDRLNEEQKKAWDAHYDKVNEEFKERKLTGDELLEWKYQRYMKDYLRCILSVDENVGRLLNYLDETGLVENTLVVYTSDQGFFLGEHGWYDKRFMYEESLCIPLIMRYPKEIKAGQLSKKMALNLDFAPTILDYAGVDIPEDMQGESLMPIVGKKNAAEWRNSMYYHYYQYAPDNPDSWHHVHKHYGIRTERYKLIHFYSGIDYWELFDLKKDPHEVNNVYNDPAYADIVKTLKTELKALQQKYGDTDFM